MRARLAAVIPVATALAVSAGACRDKRKTEPVANEPVRDAAASAVSTLPERAVLHSVAIATVDPRTSEPREVYEGMLAKQLGQQLTVSEWFVGGEDESPPGFTLRPARAEITLGYDVLAEGSEGGRSLLAMVEAEIAWLDRDGDVRVAANILAERPIDDSVTSAEIDGLLAVHLESTVHAAGVSLIAKERVRAGPPEAVVEAIGGDDDDLAAWGLAMAGERKLAQAFDVITARLRSDSEDVRDAAIGALVALGDPRGVDALADAATFEDYQLMHRVIEAVTAIGGERAEVYLEFLSTGHPDQDIRDQAIEGLRRLRRKTTPQKTTPQ